MAGRVYDDGPDHDSVFDQDRDTWWAESRHELEPNQHKIEAPGGGWTLSAWDQIAPTGFEADDFARSMWSSEP